MRQSKIRCEITILFMLACMTGYIGKAMASGVYLDCTLTSSTTHTASEETKTIERSGVVIELEDSDGRVQIRSQNTIIPINITMDAGTKEWRSGDAFISDNNRTSGRRYSLQRIVEDQISNTRIDFELDRSTGNLIQEVTQEIGEGLAVVNVTQGTCIPSKKQYNKMF